ncbi:3-oxoacyl-[acyl-carrier-protein] reductase [Clostridium botulinum]|uniref:3-oxoacyl-[acyl-carrier-protein] reductase n=2 Tax=Clostridiaceae TaxID=31979 RepID=A0A9P2LLT2_CLOBO|nr:MULTISPECIES: 3-oxoacyl-[acyl-carrier-protein] reductase [Clostridium]EES91914.1 3-oxoacyl-(acyl-carrier-protein) reductase [Clostridium botulinum D str. 1873]NFV46742.1 3-oxoacyl-[acyl-carrier-protein] reductase [Clostridium botulinum]AYF53910.1 3-oxoacyl-[acyl-carrier-protein] reductase [Clostridium novyi]MBO3441151.1 3-oxoacyl-[acyl-carrier-protein] reductase [Clostridium haemolyticum]MCD3245873.1 3-oxoacyl-[acyl-carrier-protein] reductase [Clostridium botulinum C]
MNEIMLTGKNAIVTGASRGIGRAIAIKLADLGANVVLNYRSDINSVNEVVKEIESKGVKAVAIQGDISKFEDAKKIVDEAMEKLGSIDILVNNAGITKDTLLMRMKEEEFDNVIEVNLKGVFNCTKHVVPIMMKQRSGKIINISSVVGLSGNAGQSNYAAAKAGIIGFTKSVAKEIASRGITVNAVAPGFIATDMTGVLSDKVKENIKNNIPLKRVGDAKDIANTVAFLSSNMASYITGQVISVDGGMHI